ncbi:CFF_collapsed_G0013880.mRNA.1.CDS.1 [Saccharomyces cerevisiae]|nr:CFF_collapsed_G0013880.mRNA.1.CDS.1 [Saccharomyces cerevisiae]
MDRKRSFEKLSFPSWSGKNVQKFLTLLKTNQISRATNPFKVSYSQENQLDGLHVVSSAYFEIQ